MRRRRSQYKEGTNFVGGGPRNLSAVPGAPGLGRSPINTWTEAAGHGAVIAIDPATGREKWKFKMTDVTDSGILTTGSDLLFTGGREGYFQALDARTGALLWKTQSRRGDQQRPDQLSRRQPAVRVDRVGAVALRVRARRIVGMDVVGLCTFRFQCCRCRCGPAASLRACQDEPYRPRPPSRSSFETGWLLSLHVKPGAAPGRP